MHALSVEQSHKGEELHISSSYANERHHWQIFPLSRKMLDNFTFNPSTLTTSITWYYEHGLSFTYQKWWLDKTWGKNSVVVLPLENTKQKNTTTTSYLPFSNLNVLISTLTSSYNCEWRATWARAYFSVNKTDHNSGEILKILSLACSNLNVTPFAARASHI